MAIELRIADLNGTDFLQAAALQIGKRVLLTGPNGSGKSLLLNQVTNANAAIITDGAQIPSFRILKLELDNLGWLSLYGPDELTSIASYTINTVRWASLLDSIRITLGITEEEKWDSVRHYLINEAGYSRDELDFYESSGQLDLLNFTEVADKFIYNNTHLKKPPSIVNLIIQYIDQEANIRIKSALEGISEHGIYIDRDVSTENSSSPLNDPIPDLDDILRLLNLPYRFKSLDSYISIDAAIKLNLNYTGNGSERFDGSSMLLVNDQGKEVKISQLSTGEQKMLSIGGQMYAARIEATLSGIPPRVVILDEPDAQLDPSNIALLLALINDIFEDQVVLVSTHSPSTIAIANEYKIIRMDKGKIEIVSQESAVAHAIRGVRGIIVQPSKPRDVFVEGKSDVQVFARLNEIFQRKNESSITALNFINGGSKEKVGYFVNELRQARGETRTVFGVVDWDDGSNPQANTITFASDERRALENALYDPLVILSHAVRLRRGWSINNLLNREVHIPTLLKDRTEAQLLVDHLILITPGFEGLDKSERQEVTYSTGLILDLPKIFLRMRARDYRDAWGRGPGNVFAGTRTQISRENDEDTPNKIEERGEILDTMEANIGIIPNVFFDLFTTLSKD